MNLVLVAHADDESLFMGGTIAQLSKAGELVVVVVLSDGEGSRFTIDGDSNRLPANIARQRAFRDACDVLGAESCWLPTFPDQRADSVPQLTINRAVEAALRVYEPAMVYTHHVGDLNLDHRRVAEAVLVATRQGPPIRCISPEYPDRCVGPAWAPTRSFPIADVMEAKIRACLCYGGEMREYPHPRSEQAIRQNTHESFMEIR